VSRYEPENVHGEVLRSGPALVLGTADLQF
jgi:hypothetical protein